MEDLNKRKSVSEESPAGKKSAQMQELKTSLYCGVFFFPLRETEKGLKRHKAQEYGTGNAETNEVPTEMGFVGEEIQII